MSKETLVVPNRTSIAAESVDSFPADTSDEYARNAATLTEWLGSFWSEIYENPDFVEYIQGARALRISQLYLDLLENLKLEDRENAPVFHRERWHPIILRKSKRNTGSKGMFKLVSDGTIVYGEQTNEAYPDCTRITLGGVDANYRNMVVYPLDEGSSSMLDVLTCLSNNIADATVVMSKGTGFVILDGAIAIAEELDPFEGEKADEFPKFEVVADDPADNDVETVLWASDAMFDRNFLYTALGYAMRLPARSSEVYKKVVNAAWNTVASGCTPLLLKSLMACICGIPTVKEDGEVVDRVIRDDDETLHVVTDRNVYTFPSTKIAPGEDDPVGEERYVNYTELRKDVVKGARLKRFDTLDKAIRVYPCVSDVDRIANYSEFVSDFEEFVADVPVVDLPPALFRTELEGGFSVGWEEQEVVCVGFDKNGNPKLRFHLEGSEMDEDLFWNDTWANYEEAGVSMESCLQGIEYDKIFAPGKVCGRISPMKFFMHNLIGANTLIITVRTDTLADDAPLYDPKFFGVVRDCIPAYIRLYVVEHETVYEDSFDTGTSVSDDADLNAYEEYEDEMEYGARSKKAKYHDRVDSKWVAACRDDYDD